MCLLESILQEKAPPGIRIRTINGGISGFGTSQSMGLLARLGGKYRPHIVTGMFGFNERNAFLYRDGDVYDGSNWGRANLATALRSLFYRSSTYRYLWCRLNHEQEGSAREGLKIAQVSSANVAHMRGYLQERDARFLLIFEAQVSQPAAAPITGPERLELQRTLQQTALNQHIPFMDMDAFVHSSGYAERQLIMDDCHFTPLGHQLCANQIAQRLWELGWVPRAAQVAHTSGSRASTLQLLLPRLHALAPAPAPPRPSSRSRASTP